MFFFSNKYSSFSEMVVGRTISVDRAPCLEGSPLRNPARCRATISALGLGGVLESCSAIFFPHRRESTFLPCVSRAILTVHHVLRVFSLRNFPPLSETNALRLIEGPRRTWTSEDVNAQIRGFAVATGVYSLGDEPETSRFSVGNVVAVEGRRSAWLHISQFLVTMWSI